MSQDDWRRRETALPMGRDREERSEEERRQRWMDGQIKQGQQPLNRGLTSHARRDVKGNRFGSEGLKSIQTKGEQRRMEVEDSGCQDWRWDGVRSHFSSVIALSASPPLSSLSNYRHNEAGPFLQSCIWLSGCKAITPEWSYAVFDRYSVCETQRATVGCCLTERELLLWQLVSTWFPVNAGTPPAYHGLQAAARIKSSTVSFNIALRKSYYSVSFHAKRLALFLGLGLS